MADLIYNPLLKKGFQETSDTGSIEAEIDDLRQKKVTKCKTTDELTAVEEAEIFQWQGADTSDPAELVNGYFYKKTTSQITIASGTFYVNFQNDFITPLFTIPKGYYYYVEDTTINYGYEIQKSFNNILWLSIQPCAIGNPITSVNGDVAYLTSVNNNYPVSDSLGRNWSNPTQTLSSGTFKKFKNYETGLELLLALTNPVDIVSAIDFFAFLYNDLLFPIYSFGLPAIKTTRETSITVAVFTQTNTQPPTPGITEENGTLKVSFPVEFADDVTVKGTQTVVHTEEIESENDYIELRADNPLGLANGERSGLEVNNYDGNGTDCILAVDNQGWARVGDSSGTLQKLATIEESPTDGAFVKYNATDKELQSTTDCSALTVTFTADTTLNNIVTGDTLAAICAKLSRSYNLHYTLKENITVNTIFIRVLFNFAILQFYQLEVSVNFADFATILTINNYTANQYYYGTITEIMANTSSTLYIVGGTNEVHERGGLLSTGKYSGFLFFLI